MPKRNTNKRVQPAKRNERKPKQTRPRPVRASVTESMSFQSKPMELTAQGLRCGVGPGSITAAGTDYALSASTRQGYRVRRVTMHYTPRVNQFVNTSEISGLYNGDPNAPLPAEGDMSQASALAKRDGFRVNAARSCKRQFATWTLKAGYFSTAGGEKNETTGSSYEEQGVFLIRPINVNAQVTVYGTIVFHYDVSFVGHGPSNLTAGSVVDMYKAGEWFTATDIKTIEAMLVGGYSVAFALFTDRILEVYDIDSAAGNKTAIEAIQIGMSNWVIFLDEVSYPQPPPGLIARESKAYTWNATSGTWEATAKVLPMDAQAVYNILPQVLTDEKMEAVFQRLMVKSVAEKVPVVSIENDPLNVNVVNEKLPVEEIQDPKNVRVMNRVDINGANPDPVVADVDKGFFGSMISVVDVVTKSQ